MKGRIVQQSEKIRKRQELPTYKNCINQIHSEKISHCIVVCSLLPNFPILLFLNFFPLFILQSLIIGYRYVTLKEAVGGSVHVFYFLLVIILFASLLGKVPV